MAKTKQKTHKRPCEQNKSRRVERGAEGWTHTRTILTYCHLYRKCLQFHHHNFKGAGGGISKAYCASTALRNRYTMEKVSGGSWEQKKRHPILLQQHKTNKKEMVVDTLQWRCEDGTKSMHEQKVSETAVSNSREIRKIEDKWLDTFEERWSMESIGEQTCEVADQHYASQWEISRTGVRGKE